MKKTLCVIIVLIAPIQYGYAMDSAQQLAMLEVSLPMLYKRLPPLLSEFTSEQIEQAKEELEKNPRALFDVAMHGDFEKVKLLVAAGAQVNPATGGIPLIAAALNGYTEIARFLIEKGADINRQNRYGHTALHLALSANKPEMARLLIEKGADINKADNDGRTPLYDALDQGNVELARFLIEKGADVHKRDNQGYSPLFLAVLHGLITLVQLLIEKGADVNSADDIYGSTPLLIAARDGNTKMIQLLITAGANVNIKNNIGQTSLDLARQRNNVDAEQLLLQHGAKPGTEV